MPSDYALCCVFAPGDRHVIIGTKVGMLLFNIIGLVVIEFGITIHPQ